MKALGFFIIPLVIALNTAAFAATVNSIEGPLQVNTGSGFHQVSGTTQVAPGGSVMVGPRGKAEILYSDGCRIPVTPGSVAVVAPVSPCAQGQVFPPNEDYTWYYVGGAALIAGGISCAIWCGQHKTAVATVAPASP
jgi:hypothetical protein